MEFISDPKMKLPFPPLLRSSWKAEPEGSSKEDFVT